MGNCILVKLFRIFGFLPVWKRPDLSYMEKNIILHLIIGEKKYHVCLTLRHTMEMLHSHTHKPHFQLEQLSESASNQIKNWPRVAPIENRNARARTLFCFKHCNLCKCAISQILRWSDKIYIFFLPYNFPVTFGRRNFGRMVEHFTLFRILEMTNLTGEMR